MQLQQMAGKLGIVTQMDLAQATATRPNGYDTLWDFGLAVMATDWPGT